MASFVKRSGSWRVQVRICGVTSTKTLQTKAAAEYWAKQEEHDIRERHENRQAMYKKFKHGDPHKLSADVILQNSTPNIARAGVYFLIKNDAVVYVGQSKNVLVRVSKHSINGRDFDSFYMLACEEDALDYVEAHYIRMLDPSGNRTAGNGMKAVVGVLQAA